MLVGPIWRFFLLGIAHGLAQKSPVVRSAGLRTVALYVS
eukprot:SAG31_NODE_5852_length_2296_cov_0.827947_1_plen_39_part_00